MRIAVVSDIHGNLTALEAVLSNIRYTSPDLILHGGDLADSGSSPVEIVDRIRDLGWHGVIGNTDEMLCDPNTLEVFAVRSPSLQALWTALREMADAAREKLGEERLSWLRALPSIQTQDDIALMHASPQSAWQAPLPEASDAELESVYREASMPIVVYGHIHRPYIRRLPEATIPGRIIVNTGSVSLSHDGDRRASYALIENGIPTIRRVEYDLDRELKALHRSGIPQAEWVARMLQSASPQMP